MPPNLDWFVEGVPLHGRAPGFADGLDHVGFGLQLRRCRAGHVEDVFLDDRAVQIVRAVAQTPPAPASVPCPPNRR